MPTIHNFNWICIGTTKKKNEIKTKSKYMSEFFECNTMLDLKNSKHNDQFDMTCDAKLKIKISKQTWFCEIKWNTQQKLDSLRLMWKKERQPNRLWSNGHNAKMCTTRTGISSIKRFLSCLSTNQTGCDFPSRNVNLQTLIIHKHHIDRPWQSIRIEFEYVCTPTVRSTGW